MDTTCTFHRCNRQAHREGMFIRPCGHGPNGEKPTIRPVCGGCFEGNTGPAKLASPCPTCGDLNRPALKPTE